MTFFSFADACRHLSIDAKTLRRWLVDAQLSLQAHPHDGRKKSVSQEQLDLLARLHHRDLLSPTEPPPPPVLADPPPLPASLLALPEQLAALQAQVAALHQQIAALASHLTLSPSSTHSPAPPPKRAKHPSTPASSAPPSTSPASPRPKQPPKPVHVIPRVEYASEGRYVVMCPKKGRLLFEPDSPEWFAWVATQESFRFVGKAGHFTAYHWWRVPRGAWRAHRHIRNQMYTLRLAPNHELTIAVLEQAAEALQAHLA